MNVIRGFSLVMKATTGRYDIHVGNDGASVVIGEGCSGNWDLRLWKAAVVHVGRGTSCNGARLICDNSEIEIGHDCMLSDEIILQSADQHGIVDLESGEIVNQERKCIRVGNHVWIGRRANLLYGSRIGNGAIIGFGALVNSRIPENSLAVGVPARVVRREVTWSRETTSLDDYSSHQVFGDAALE